MAIQSQAGGGRLAQKARTRALIVDAARRLAQPTVEEAADAAGVSRATAYRYFPTQEALSVELGTVDIWRVVDVLGATQRVPEVRRRLDRLVDAIVTKALMEERPVRTALRVYHDTWLRDPGTPVRKGRRMEWIERAIAPLDARRRAKLGPALALAIGPDPVIMLKDVARLDPAQIKRTLKWTAAALLEAALAEA